MKVSKNQAKPKQTFFSYVLSLEFNYKHHNKHALILYAQYYTYNAITFLDYPPIFTQFHKV